MCDGVPISHFRGDKVRALLAYLAVEADRPHARTTLATLFWPEQPKEQALGNLSQALVRLRRALGHSANELLRVTRHDVQWLPGAIVDVTTFVEHAMQAEVGILEQAAALYGGELLSGFGLAGCEEFEVWLLLTREQLQQRALRVLERITNLHLAAGRYSEAALAARRQIDLDPWHELAYRQLMDALVRLNDRAGALGTYERCRRVLLADLGTEPDAATAALADQIRTDRPGPAELSRPISTFPAPLTALVGREQELETLDSLLHAGTRLVTVLGAGGVGKTRLVLAAAAIVRKVFADGVWWVSLASINGDGTPTTQENGIVDAILASLGMLPSGQHSLLKEVCELLQHQTLLLVLDNCEHLSSVAPTIGDLLEAVPGLQILATSRERLGVYGEHLLALEGLPTPTEADQQAESFASVQLFLARARRQVRNFGNDPATLASVAQLCQLLEGMPLGIELAAHWVGDYLPDEIAAAVRADLAFLGNRDRHLPDRHRSLQAVFDYSWGLLFEAERRVLARLSVFVGEFDRSAAFVIAEARPTTLAALVDKSMLRRISAGRYSMHALLRQFAAEQLSNTHAYSTISARHGRFYLAFVADREWRIMRDQPRIVAAEISAEIDNIRQAWNWALDMFAVAEIAQSANGLYHFYAMTGQTVERDLAFGRACQSARSYTEQVPDDPAGWRTLGLVLAFYATNHIIRGQYDQAIQVAQEAITLSSWNPEAHVLASIAWGWALSCKSQFQEACVQIENTLALVVLHKPAYPTSEVIAVVERAALLRLGGIHSGLSNFEQARAYMLQALQLCQSQGRRSGEMDSLLYLANIACTVYDLPTAQDYYQRALQLVPKMGTRTAEGLILSGFGDVARLQGAYQRACALIEQALTVFREIGETEQEYRATAIMMQLYVCLGDQLRATEWFERLAPLKKDGNTPELDLDVLLSQIVYLRSIGQTQQALTAATQCWQLAETFGHSYAQAQALIALAHAQASVGYLEAEALYQQALAIYTALGQAGLAAEAWAGLATMALARGDTIQAIEYVEPIMQAIAAQERIGLAEPLTIYLICYRVLAANNDQRAAALLHSAYAHLIEQVQQIDRAEWQHSFLAHVPTHQAIIAEAERRTD